ncbi:hypothetical protein EWM64_g2457 [Hericium alpestre]|uniref:Uncharacterized protein n=1 Tax=Hericium alpestre TaxID=135208 RepID=A0A4Z0A5E7_9AGAM|nr:hypothetical protein EWM64_g2457 [Hericium alpestre]
MDEIVATLTLDAYKGKIVVILAGYDQEMNGLMAVNTGLSSRFPDEIVFENMKPARCLELLSKELKKDGVSVAELDNPESSQYAEMSGLIAFLSALPSWGNARDMMTLSKQMVRTAFKNTSVDNNGAMLLSAADVISCVSGMLRDRRERSSNVPLNPEQRNLQFMQQILQPDAPTAPIMHTSSAVKAKAAPPKAAEATQTPAAEEADDPRDDGVPDSVWRQLCADKKAAEEAARRVEEDLRVMEQELREAEAREKEEKKRKLAKQIAAKQAKDAAERDAVQRQLEEQRLKEIHAQAERQRKAAQLAAKKQREEEERRKEAMVQAKLRDMGVCEAGFRWVKQADGYRCTAGGHWISNAQLGI